MNTHPPLPAPHPALEACVVVPARDEEKRIAACLGALANQEGVAPGAWEVLLVLDHCRDATRDAARTVCAANPLLTLHLLAGPGRGSGGARATGMDAACARLLGLGRPRGLIASTDADTWADPSWLYRQLELSRAGARAIGGRIELCPVERRDLPPAVLDGHAARSQRRFRRVLAQATHAHSVTDHWQFSGASMSVTAETYAEVGGLGDGTHSEDEHLERALIARSVPIERHLDVRVTTSARMTGRASHGLARVLRELSA
ncbi:MAG: glycosyltransferase family 2 protein [Thermoleophilaceae bacterium]